MYSTKCKLDSDKEKTRTRWCRAIRKKSKGARCVGADDRRIRVSGRPRGRGRNALASESDTLGVRSKAKAKNLSEALYKTQSNKRRYTHLYVNVLVSLHNSKMYSTKYDLQNALYEITLYTLRKHLIISTYIMLRRGIYFWRRGQSLPTVNSRNQGLHITSRRSH